MKVVFSCHGKRISFPYWRRIPSSFHPGGLPFTENAMCHVMVAISAALARFANQAKSLETSIVGGFADPRLIDTCLMHKFKTEDLEVS